MIFIFTTFIHFFGGTSKKFAVRPVRMIDEFQERNNDGGVSFPIGVADAEISATCVAIASEDHGSFFRVGPLGKGGIRIL